MPLQEDQVQLQNVQRLPAVCPHQAMVQVRDMQGDFHLQTQETHVEVQAMQQGDAGVSVFYFSVYK